MLYLRGYNGTKNVVPVGGYNDTERMMCRLKRFKKIILEMQAQNKSCLNWLYVDRFTKNPDLAEDEKVFSYGSLLFSFMGTGHRNPERIIMTVSFPTEADPADAVPVGTYLLSRIEPAIRAWNEENKNDNKAREKARFTVQSPGNRMLRRSGIIYDGTKRRFALRILFQVPLVNAVSVNGKAAYRGVSDILELIAECLASITPGEPERYVRTYRHQQIIRKYLESNGYCAFIANGSILPREKDSDEPMKAAVPFNSPEEAEVTSDLGDGNKITGMGIACGITVITGGGYSGKSTLLDALENGIYDHIPGDGREYVITDSSALKIYAEDGRPVTELDLSAFFRFLPGKSLTSFSTDHASGSVSQAGSIKEAVCGGSHVLLIDEDKSATNFMIRDRMMRLLVDDEPIIPFTERVGELWKNNGVSTILVIGGSGEYLKLADSVILMKEYLPYMITGKVNELLKEEREDCPTESGDGILPAEWHFTRKLLIKESAQAFLYFRTVETENEKKIILDDYTADVTMLTALSTHEQLCTLTVMMERMLTDMQGKDREIIENAREYIEEIMDRGKTGSIMPETQSWFYEEIRPIDVLCCVNRMRGVRFVS